MLGLSFNFAARKTNTYKVSCKTISGAREFERGATVQLRSNFGIAVLRATFWQGNEENVVRKNVRFPGTVNGMEKFKRTANHWARTGRF